MALRKPVVLINGKFEELSSADWIAMRRTWSSGMVHQYEEVISPADGEIYQRTAATGGGTTDPADDVTNYVARSFRRTVALPNVTAFNHTSAISTTSIARGAVRVGMSAVAVGVRGSVLSITGRGNIDYLALNKSTSDSMLIEIVCDGRTIFSQNPGLNNVNGVALPIGLMNGAADTTNPLYFAAYDPQGVEFRRSLSVFVTPVTSDLPAGAVLAYHVRSVS